MYCKQVLFVCCFVQLVVVSGERSYLLNKIAQWSKQQQGRLLFLLSFLKNIFVSESSVEQSTTTLGIENRRIVAVGANCPDGWSYYKGKCRQEF